MKNHILNINDPKEEKLLRKKARRIENAQATDIIILGQTMSRICSQPGVAGIAATQLGMNVRMFALSQGTGKPALFFINPRIVGLSEETQQMMEGCLSVPLEGGLVERHDEVRLSWYDHNKRRYEYTFKGFWAEAVQHEMDHLDGVVYKDKAIKMFTEDELKEQWEIARKKAEEELAKLQAEDLAADEAEKMSADELATIAEADMTSPLKELEKHGEE